jgi:hypothetical protein
MPSRTRSILLALAVVALVGGLALGAVLYGFTRPQPESLEHAYEYELVVEPDADLSNVTLYLPVPVENGSSPVADAVAGDASAVRVEGDPGWDASVVDTEYGPMLALSVADLPARYVERPPPQPMPDDSDATPPPAGTPTTRLSAYRLVVELPAVDAVDTETPLDSEPTLRPRLDATETDCDRPTPDRAVCRTFETRTYLSYDAPADARTTVIVRYEGRNTWFAGGWTGNQFDQRTSVVATGPGEGWVAVPVAETTSLGRYPTPG